MQVYFCIFFIIPERIYWKYCFTAHFLPDQNLVRPGDFVRFHPFFMVFKRKIQKIYSSAIDFFKKSVKLRSVTRKCYPDRKKFQSEQEKPHTPAEAVSFSPELASAPFFQQINTRFVREASHFVKETTGQVFRDHSSLSLSVCGKRELLALRV